ncbi:hypothetical protein [Chitinophaga rhizophila]|uniref:Uncharacterized protein n=1 Tax=Chitinophaga rhizophila TaxID=2866212 RepID=A0ABS7GIY6_9BACT|nr:hypothetical protein [Chitinophaga rhizophila]MBW8686744.1 hypothetical protein [Chitinophaga rhizophila]
MARLFAYILLFVHVNTTMFVPVADERDVYDACGRQINDINTFLGLIDQVILGNTAITTQDEDDDLAHYFTGSTGVTCFVSNMQEIVLTREEPSTVDLAVAFPRLQVQKVSSIAYDILTPPPEARINIPS